MYNPDEIIKIKWTTRNKKYYENIGYQYTKIGEPLDVTVGDLPPDSNIRITATCDCEQCQKPQLTPYRNYNRIVKNNGLYLCKPCTFEKAMNEKTEKSHERLYNLFLEKCDEHDCIPLTTFEEFGGSKSFVKYICPIHGEVETSMSNIVGSDAWCYKCGKMSMADKQRLTLDIVKERIESKNGNVLLNPEDYVNSSTKNLKVICGSCGRPFITSYSAQHNGDGRCAKCGCMVSGDMLRTTYEEFIDMATISDKLMVANPDDYDGMDYPLWFYCSSCNRPFLTKPKNYLRREFTRCPDCHLTIRSKGIENIKLVLDEFGIKYIAEHRFDDCIDKRKLPFDLYLNEINKIIEYDGMQHYQPVEFFGGEEHFQMIQRHDQIKNDYCAQNGIPLLRIPYWETENIRDMVISFINDE